MPVTNEVAVLQRLLMEIDDSGAEQRQRRNRVEAIANRVFAGIIVLAIAGTGLIDLVWHDILLFLGAFALGFSVAWDAVRYSHSRNMDIVEKYLDRSRIERRLQMLKTSSGD